MHERIIVSSDATNRAEPASGSTTQRMMPLNSAPPSPGLDALRADIRAAYLADESAVARRLIEQTDLDPPARARIESAAVGLVRELRETQHPGTMEAFLAEYGLTTREGVALMSLAEALLRVDDSPTVDALIWDKIAPADWGRHLGHSSSPLVNASTWALMLTGKVIGAGDAERWDLVATLRGVLRRTGWPMVRTAVGRAMQVLGHQFVLGRDIDEARARAAGEEARGYTYSYDVLGEAALTSADARRYFLAYSKTITALCDQCAGSGVRDNPGVSVKLSALHPRYEYAQRARVLAQLTARLGSLALLAKNANMGLSVDAEEADRLDLSLDVIEAVLSNPDLERWEGFGVVVQAYMPRAPYVLDWLYALARRYDRRIMVRLVKGAYWDGEVKHAQVLGLPGYPVFTRKVTTDLCYLACARRLLAMTDRIYPQFATHNAHSAAAVLEMARDTDAFEFQRLHGMGEALHELLRARAGRRCRIYAPVGVHRDLLAYLVRRLLENGANSSFVSQVLDRAVPAAAIVRDPAAAVQALTTVPNPRIPSPPDLYGAARRNSRGLNLADPTTLAWCDTARAPFRCCRWHAAPVIAGLARGGGRRMIRNPADSADIVGEVVESAVEHVEQALAVAAEAAAGWGSVPVGERAACLERVADLYEDNIPELMALATREAGKTLVDAIAEVREAVDFCRYYAAQARELGEQSTRRGRGVFVCISPWNFPLAILTGQIVAALVTGNAVIAKPAEQTPLMAARAVALMHQAGIPTAALNLLPGDGPAIGGALVADPRTAGVCFTGSGEAAHSINQALAQGADPAAPLIAETGGLNAMVVDSSALPEQVVRDVVTSTFRSAGQRCSALRILLLQREIAEPVLEMLAGAMDELTVGDPWELATDVGPVIDREAYERIVRHERALEREGRLLRRAVLRGGPPLGIFVAPALYRLDRFEQLREEIFGPILHAAVYEAADLDAVIDAINAAGYGLTLGIHTRVDHRVQRIVGRARVGNIYVNRNQIGAVVGVQPFGGEGLSGTGPKAGGPLYLERFTERASAPEGGTRERACVDVSAVDPIGVDSASVDAISAAVSDAAQAQPAWDARRDRLTVLERAAAGCPEPVSRLVQAALGQARRLQHEPLELPGPTGESNRYSLHGRGVFLCLGRAGGGDAGAALEQAVMALALGNGALVGIPGGQAQGVRAFLDVLLGVGAEQAIAALVDSDGWAALCAEVAGLSGVALDATPALARVARRALASRPGPIVPLVSAQSAPNLFVTERTLSIDTTASGGNAALLAASAEPLA